MKKSLQQAINLAVDVSAQCPNQQFTVFEKAGKTPRVTASGEKALSMLAEGWHVHASFKGGHLI